ncbi:hypothetical protein TrLO_g4832 [Triparma laevis f. longispina]|uniref:EF-hand domain-containing protein n=1 Tax=Triparma laevis f. longispina TaxID=1714387 RepID=A0A9W7FNS4_9STRA|nr:hypothetical protein TrLO_g4832 [Triparma laevis f. longispina]
MMNAGDNKEFFFNSAKFILYSIRTYCLSKPVHKFKDLFMQYDENSDGSLDVDEIHHGIVRMGFDVPLETAVEIMTMIDLDGNQVLDFSEFRCAVLDERIAADFEEHELRTYNECKLQEEYRERCLMEPNRASIMGPAAEPLPSEGYKYHRAVLDQQLSGLAPKLTAKEKVIKDIEEKRKVLKKELMAKKKADALRHGEKDSKEKQQFMTNIEDKFKNLRAAFSRMDADGSGFLDKREMEQVCFELNLPESWTDALIADADKDGDGEISYVEFVKALERKSTLGKVASEEHHIFDWETDSEAGGNQSLLPAVMGDFNYRSGPSVPKAMPLAGGWDFATRQKTSKAPLLFSAHASHINNGSQVVQDGMTQCCVRPMSHIVKAKAPHFLK